MNIRPKFGPVFEKNPRGRLLSAAASLFSKNGINATGIDRVIEDAGTAKTTLYSAFGSKEGLVVAVLEAESDAWLDWFSKEINKVKGSGRDKLVATFTILQKWFEHDKFYGCPLFNAMAEAPASDTQIRKITFNHRSTLERQLKVLALEDGLDNVDRLVAELMILFDGAIISASISRDPNAAKSAASAFATILSRSTRVAPVKSEERYENLAKMAVE